VHGPPGARPIHDRHGRAVARESEADGSETRASRASALPHDEVSTGMAQWSLGLAQIPG
jgi:hypothetical protein